MRFCLSLLPLLSLPFLTGCPAPQTADAPAPVASPPGGTNKNTGAFADLDPWVLKTTDVNTNRGNHGIYLANGRIGATFGASGGAGTDAVNYVAGIYDRQENLARFPNWQQIDSQSPTAGSAYRQSLDLQHGTLTTQYGAVTVTALLDASLSKDERGATGGIQITGAASAIAPSPTPANNVLLDSIPWSYQDSKTQNSNTRIASYQGQGPSAYTPPANFDVMRKAHEAAWAKRWADADITIEGDLEAQQLVHKLQFDLMQSVRVGGDDSIAPEALSGDFYKGHIFWDAEVWMLPALLPQHPDLARNLLDYRYKHLAQAKAQAKAQNCQGADFPWESAASGKEVAPQGFSKGRHVTAGIGWAVWQYWLATNDKVWMQQRGWPLLSNIADYFATRAKKNPTTGKYDIADVTGPDEFGVGVTNNTYTNAMARNCLLYGTQAAPLVGNPSNPRWKTVADNLALPFDKTRGVYLKCDGDQGKPGTKQADGELLLWPAQLPMDPKTQAATFDFHKTRVIKNGPAMTASIHALIAARLNRAGEAEQAFRDSYRPFVRGPFLLFSEKRSLDRCVFTTGAGGVLQSILYGFGGLDYTQPTGILPGPVALPKGWTKLTLTGIHRAGKTYTLTITPQGRTLTPQ